MDTWSRYDNRVIAHGGSKYNASLMREVRSIHRKLPDNLSYTAVDIYPMEYGYNIEQEESINHMLKQNVAIINSDNLNEKRIISMPGEDIVLGSLVYWKDNHWLVVERDANTTVYTRAKLLQCNYLLKWITPESKIIEQWCVVEDGTKLKRDKSYSRNSLACWKRHVKTTSLIAGNPLELYGLQRSVEIRKRESLKTIRIGQSAAKLRIGERSTTNPVAGVKTSVLKREALNHIYMAW